MGFTIQDMLTVCGPGYSMELIAGKNGWSNSINWTLMVEDTIVIKNFRGKELAVTLGVGFDTEEELLELTQQLVAKHAAGLIINVGNYIAEVPQSVRDYCDQTDLPLITVPWKVYIVDMIRDISRRISIQEAADEKIVQALIGAIEHSDTFEECRKELRPYFDIDGDFQIILFSTEGLGEMDTVIRKMVGNRLAIYLENITHNGSFFYYDSDFVLMLNDISEENKERILKGMQSRAGRRMPENPIYSGIGSRMKGLTLLQTSYKRAKAALRKAQHEKKPQVDFDEMGIERLLYTQEDGILLEEMSRDALAPLEEYDRKHDGCYVETLECYLRNNCSIQTVAEKLYTHRNTVIYRINNIKKLLDCDLTDPMDRLRFLLAIMIRHMEQ